MNGNKKSLNKNLVLCQIHRSFEVHEAPYTEATLYNHLSLIDDNIAQWTMDGLWKGKSVYLQRLSFIKSWKHANHWHEYKIQEISEIELSVTLDYIYQNILPDNSINNYTVTTVVKMSLEGKFPIITDIKILSQLLEGVHEFENSYLKTRAHSLVRYWLYNIETRASLNELFTPEFSIIIDHKKETRTIEDNLKDVAKQVYPAKNIELDIQSLSVKQLASGKVEVLANIISQSDETVIQHRWLCDNIGDKPFMQISQFEIVDKWVLTTKSWQRESASF